MLRVSQLTGFNAGQARLPDPYFANVSLLIYGTGTNGQTTFTDSSSYAHSLVRVGDTQVATDQSPFGGGSIRFDGSGDYLTIAGGNELCVEAGAFTVEAWVYFTANTTGTIYARASASGVAYEHVFGFNDGRAEFYYGIRGTNQSLTRFFWPSTLTTNTWHHLVIQRDGSGNWGAWVDGVPTTTYQTAPLAAALVFGSVINGTYNNAVNLGTGALTNSVGGTQPGIYVGNNWGSNYRLTKGIARYSGTFAVPSRPFPNF